MEIRTRAENLSDPPEAADVHCPTAFCKTRDGFFTLGETAKFLSPFFTM